MRKRDRQNFHTKDHKLELYESEEILLFIQNQIKMNK